MDYPYFYGYICAYMGAFSLFCLLCFMWGAKLCQICGIKYLFYCTKGYKMCNFCKESGKKRPKMKKNWENVWSCARNFVPLHRQSEMTAFFRE